MVILHCMKKAAWEAVQHGETWGQESVTAEGFVHCSPVGYFWRVAPLFKDVKDELVLVLLETKRLTSPLKWEDGENLGREYPHVYGPLNTSAVVGVLPFLWDERGDFVKNPELSAFANE